MTRNTRLIPLRCAALAALLLCAAGASAQLVKWVDAKGVVHYSDKAPPPGVKPADIKTPAVGASAVTLPYELAQAARKHPVVLYTSSQCPACDLGRTLLKTRGIPFTEKTVGTDADADALKDAGGGGQLPLLLVGRSKVTGFESTEWQGMLTAAAYPAESMLPPAYQYQVAAAAPAPAPAPSMAAANAEPPASPPKRKVPAPAARPETPPGFQF